jgi:Ribbon-helix-helix protein, copG family
MVRKQIVVPEDVDARIRRLAARRGVSQSAVVVEAIRAIPERDPPEDEQDIERIPGWSGVVKGLPADLSEQVDGILHCWPQR